MGAFSQFSQYGSISDPAATLRARCARRAGFGSALTEQFDGTFAFSIQLVPHNHAISVKFVRIGLLAAGLGNRRIGLIQDKNA